VLALPDLVGNVVTIAVVGLDLSLSSTGVTLPDGTSRTIRPRAGSDDNSRRLHEIVTRLDLYLKVAKPDVGVIESVFVSRNRKVAMLLAGLAWCVRHRFFELDIPYVDVAPAVLKEYATGNGHASKDEMVEAARMAGAVVANDDEADSFWLHAMGRSQYSATWEPAYRSSDLLSTRERVRASIKWPILEVASA
jgi:Holliday junction resolvasome RuvABC endonuclease subunit